MNPRLAKELRPLWLPWALAAAAAIGHLAVGPGSTYFHGAFGDFVVGLAGFGFVAGVLVLAAMPMGSELHERTLTLLLSQPVPRERLWREKLAAATLMIASLGIIHAAAIAVMGRFNSMQALFFVAFTVTSICSVGFHTLATRSVLVGIASAVGLPYAITLSTFLIAHYLFEFELHLSEGEMLALITVASFIYSVFCLRISQRQFVNLQSKDATVSRAAEIPAALIPRTLSNLFRCEPTGVTLNLTRKEVCLHKPLFLVSAIFTAAWLLTLFLMLLRPAWNDTCVGILNGLTGTQVVLMVILGGCVALGDDKALGTSAWHLTLPISARRQWSIKVLTALGTTFTMAVILPSLLAVLTLFKARVGFLTVIPAELFGAMIPLPAVFVLSFWSASMTMNTVRAALTTILATAILAMALAAGVLSAEWIGGIQTLLLPNLIARYQWSPYALNTVIPVETITVFLTVLAILIALRQSFLMFRQTGPRRRTVIRCSVVLTLVVFGIAFWRHDLDISMRKQSYYWFIQGEVVNAFRNTMLQDYELAEGQTRRAEVRDLIKNQQLSERARQWVRNAEVTIHWNKGMEKHAPVKTYVCELRLPSGAIVPLIWSVPEPSPSPVPQPSNER